MAKLGAHAKSKEIHVALRVPRTIKGSVNSLPKILKNLRSVKKSSTRLNIAIASYRPCCIAMLEQSGIVHVYNSTRVRTRVYYMAIPTRAPVHSSTRVHVYVHVYVHSSNTGTGSMDTAVPVPGQQLHSGGGHGDL